MILTSPVLVALLSVLVGIVLGYILRQVMAQYKKNSLEVEVKKMLLDAKDQAVKILDEAKKKSEEVLEQSKKETKEREGQIRKLEEKVLEKDESLKKRSIDFRREKVRNRYLGENSENRDLWARQARAKSPRYFGYGYSKNRFLNRIRSDNNISQYTLG